MEQYVMLEKAVGETPLAAVEAWRTAAGIAASVPLAYAGRLDPMASGKLLVLIGDECKNQTAYHGLDKAYDFSVLIGIGSDTHDVLGRLYTAPVVDDQTPEKNLTDICKQLEGSIELPYPHFSAKTVHGKPLHMWTLEGKLDDIIIPTKTSTIYSLQLTDFETTSRAALAAAAKTKIDTIPEVTDPRKALGNDFRRADVRRDWADIAHNNFSTGNVGPVTLPDTYCIAHFHCIASSGTYMRTLAHVIGGRLSPPNPTLAWHIHRTHIGIYDPINYAWKLVY